MDLNQPKILVMKTIRFYCLLFLSLVLIIIIDRCIKETPKVIPTITASAVSKITFNSASASGNVLTDGGAEVTERGTCWSSVNVSPTTSDSKTSDGIGTGVFNSIIAGLSPNTTYYISVYATNSVGTAYFILAPFKSLANIPVLTTTTLSSVSANSFISGGNIINDGGSPVTSRGVCWSKTQNPTVSDLKTTDGTGTGSFTSSVTGLASDLAYFVRAYATNSIGTAYGNLVTNSAIVNPNITTTAITLITSTTASCGGTISTDGGNSIWSRGVCWSTFQNPTTKESKTADGATIGKYSSSLTDLLPNTTYYVRAYYYDGFNTNYGGQTSFTTSDYPNCGTVLDVDGNIYKTVTIGSQCWLRENLKTTKYNDGKIIHLITDSVSWNLDTIGAYCWYNNDELTYKSKYGALYNWHTVNTKKLCPTGWHVPSDNEWSELFNYLGGDAIAGGKLKEAGLTHWLSPNKGATNETGFTALPGGWRYTFFTLDDQPQSYFNGLRMFEGVNMYGYWWSSTGYSTYLAYSRYLGYGINEAGKYDRGKRPGFSVRCVMGD